MRLGFHRAARRPVHVSTSGARGKILRSWATLTIILIAGLCASLFAAEPEGVVLVGAGSSVPLPLYHKWADLYNQSNKTVQLRSEEHTSELQSHSFISYAVFCL